MKNISLTFKIHHPVLLKKYYFFDIGNDSYYYDDLENERIIRKAADECYLPTNEILTDLLIKYNGQFKVAFSISGTAVDLFALYAPDVIESFQKLAATGCVEFLGETYAHSLASLKDKDEFRMQTKTHSDKMEELFGQQPRVFINTGLIYSDNIGEMADELGFKAVLTEGAGHILKWRSPNHVYCNPVSADLKILLNNSALTEAIAFRFSIPGWTGRLTDANNYITALNKIPEDEKIVNLIMDYEMIGRGQRHLSGTNNFLKSFPQSIFEMTEYGFMNPSELIYCNQSIAPLNVVDTISSAPFEEELLLYLGNDLQQEAVGKLYELKEKIDHCNDHDLLKDWLYLQTSDHFRYMVGKKYSDAGFTIGTVPYENFYEAFMNYMNVLNDFSIRVNKSIAIFKNDFVLKKLMNQIAI